MHILHIEAVAEGTPSLAENLRPLLSIIHRNAHVGQIHLLAQVGLALRNVCHEETLALLEQCLAAARRYIHESTVGHRLLLLILQIVEFRAATRVVIDLLARAIGREIERGSHRNLHDAFRQAIHIDANRLCLRAGRRAFITLSCLVR